MEDTDFTLNILHSPLAPTQCLIHSRQEGGRKEKQEKLSGWIKHGHGGKMRKDKGGGERISQEIPVPSCEKLKHFIAFWLQWTAFVVMKKRDRQIFLHKTILLSFHPLIISFGFNHLEWCGPKMLLSSRNVARAWTASYEWYTQVHLKCKPPLSSVGPHLGVDSKNACKSQCKGSFVLVLLAGFVFCQDRGHCNCLPNHSGPRNNVRSCVFLCVAATGLLLWSSKCLV